MNSWTGDIARGMQTAAGSTCHWQQMGENSPLTWKVSESQGINLVRESQGILLVVREF